MLRCCSNVVQHGCSQACLQILEGRALQNRLQLTQRPAIVLSAVRPGFLMVSHRRKVRIGRSRRGHHSLVRALELFPCSWRGQRPACKLCTDNLDFRHGCWYETVFLKTVSLCWAVLAVRKISRRPIHTALPHFGLTMLRRMTTLYSPCHRSL